MLGWCERFGADYRAAHPDVESPVESKPMVGGSATINNDPRRLDQ
jgi:hypothetical protein